VSTPTAAAAEALKAHQWWFVGNLGVPGMPDRKDYKCSCGWTAGGGIGEGEDPHEHVAAAVLEALGLTPEWTVESRWGVEEHNVSDFYATPANIAEWRNRNDLPTEVMRRLVGPWSVAPQEQPPQEQP
jgi:hypothetical protein